MTTDISTAKVITQHGPRDFDATFDGNYLGSFRTQRDAEQALDDHVMDLIEHGLIDTPLTALDVQPCIHCGAVQDRASCDECVTWPEVEQAAALDTFQAELIADLDTAPTYHAPGHCRNCGGPHHVQKCPEVAAALADPDEQPSGDPWPDGLMLMPEGDILDTDGMRVLLDQPAIVRKTIVAWQCNRAACTQWLATFNDAEQRMLAQAVIAYRRQFFDTGLTVERLVGAWKGG